MKKEFFVALDIETDGLNYEPTNDDVANIIRISAIKFDKNGKIKRKFCRLIKPPKPISESVEIITKITNKKLRYKLKDKWGFKGLNRFVKNATIVGYNMSFTLGFLKFHGKKYGLEFNNETIDVYPLIKERFPELKSYSVSKIAQYLSINRQLKEKYFDVEVIMKLHQKLLNNYS